MLYSLYPASVTTKQGLCEDGRSSEHRSHVEPRGIHLLEHTAATGTRMSIMVCEEIKTILLGDRCQRQEHSREAILTRPNSQHIEERARSSENVQSPVRCCLVCCLFDPDCCQSSGRRGQQEPFRRGQGRSEVRKGRRHFATGVHRRQWHQWQQWQQWHAADVEPRIGGELVASERLPASMLASMSAPSSTSTRNHFCMIAGPLAGCKRLQVAAPHTTPHSKRLRLSQIRHHWYHLSTDTPETGQADATSTQKHWLCTHADIQVRTQR
jgi:hypothetical protein